jgi:protein-tyrosine-phosphatase
LILQIENICYSQLAEAMVTANGPDNDNMQQALDLAGSDTTLLIKAISLLAQRQLEEMFKYHGVHVIGGG